MHEHALDLADRPRLPDEAHARRRVAARARLGDEPEHVARGVAHERQRVGAELGRDQLARAVGTDGLAALRVEEFAEEVAGVEVHAVVHPALAGERTDLRLAAVVEQLDAEGRLEVAAQRGRERLGRRKPDAVAEPEPHRARHVAQAREEARRAGVDARPVVVCDLHLQLARPRAAVDDETAGGLEGPVQAQAAGHDVIGERHVRDLAGAHAHRADRCGQHRGAARLGREPRDVDRPGGRVQRGDLGTRHRQEIAEGRVRALRRDQVGLAEPRHPGAEGVVALERARAHAGRVEHAPVVRRALVDPGERLAQPSDLLGGRRPTHAAGANRGRRQGSSAAARAIRSNCRRSTPPRRLPDGRTASGR